MLGYISSRENNNPNWPDIQFFISHKSDPVANLSAIENIRPDLNSIAIYLNRPQSSRGFIKLLSTDPTDNLYIQPNYATYRQDIDRLVQGIEFIVDLYENSNAYAGLNARLNDANFPAACKALPYRSQEYWSCVVMSLGTSGHHFVGTCSMNYAIDSKLKVFHTQGLRVADSSIMPTLPNGNTNAPAIMIGERASDFILRQWGN